MIQIIKTEKEPRYKIVSADNLQVGDWIEVDNELACVTDMRPNSIIQLFYPQRNHPDNLINYCDYSHFNKVFPVIYLCDAKIIYERVLL